MLVNRTGHTRTADNIGEGPMAENFLPPRDRIVELTPLAELAHLDASRKERNDIRGRLNLQEFNDEKRRAFLLGRMAKTAPPVESKVQKATWHDEMVTQEHQWDESPMRVQPWERE